MDPKKLFKSIEISKSQMIVIKMDEISEMGVFNQ